MLESGEKSVQFERVRARTEVWPAWIEHPRRRALRRGLAVQRVFDVVASCILIVLSSPVMALVTLAILIEDGRPVMFFQKRIGRERKTFRMCKFRSMHQDADQEFHRRHTEMVVSGEAPLRIADDPRITRVGRLIRRLSIDELPNLFNVLSGDMSIVGPRPLVPYEAAAIPETHSLRFSVRPGITGLAQISGRLDLSHAQRLDLNVDYVMRRSILTDLWIVLRTIPAMFLMRG